MHLGNVFTAVLSWLAAKSTGGRWVLRIEDLDPQRSRLEHARQIEDDLRWLGLEWDEGGLDGAGTSGPYLQSLRGDIYEAFLDKLRQTGYTYPCFCTRADIMATQAPHQSDGRVVYAGTCRPSSFPSGCVPQRPHATRIYVPDEEIVYSDVVFGPQSVNLAWECGDFILRRADGAWAYQLAVVVDDALMGVRQVVRGADLLLSAAQQIYLYRMLGLEHLPSPISRLFATPKNVACQSAMQLWAWPSCGRPTAPKNSWGVSPLWPDLSPRLGQYRSANSSQNFPGPKSTASPLSRHKASSYAKPPFGEK